MKTEYDIKHTIIPTARIGKKRMYRSMGMPFGTFLRNAVIAVSVIGILLFAISVFSSKEGSITPITMYLKGNDLSAIYRGNKIELGRGIVDERYSENISEDVDNRKLVRISNDGEYIYFFKNYDVVGNFGDLYVSFKGAEANMITTVVHNSIVISPDGSSVLLLSEADDTGNMGILYKFEYGKDLQKLASDIDKDTYAFARNGKSVLFIENYDTTIMSGDLYLQEGNKDKKLIDNNVHKIFGTDESSKTYIYAKDYSFELDAYDIYRKRINGSSEKIIDSAGFAPIFTVNNKSFILAAKDGDTFSLFLTDLRSGKIERIDSGIKNYAGISKDKKGIIYYKPGKNEKVDFYVYKKSGKPNKISNNIVDPENMIHVAVDNDFTKFFYITDYNEEEEAGVLLYTRLRSGKLTDRIHISSNAHTVEMSGGGTILAFTADYDSETKLADLYTYAGNTDSLIAERIDPYFVSVNENGILTMHDYNYDATRGDLNIYSITGKFDEIAVDAINYTIRNDGSIVFTKDYDGRNGTFDLYMTDTNLKNTVKLDEDVTHILNLL